MADANEQHEVPNPERLSGEEISARQDAEIAELQKAYATGGPDMHGPADDRPGDNGPAGEATPFVPADGASFDAASGQELPSDNPADMPQA